MISGVAEANTIVGGVASPGAVVVVVVDVVVVEVVLVVLVVLVELVEVVLVDEVEVVELVEDVALAVVVDVVASSGTRATAVEHSRTGRSAAASSSRAAAGTHTRFRVSRGSRMARQSPPSSVPMANTRSPPWTWDTTPPPGQA
jgi:hypothetical protein